MLDAGDHLTVGVTAVVDKAAQGTPIPINVVHGRGHLLAHCVHSVLWALGGDLAMIQAHNVLGWDVTDAAHLCLVCFSCVLDVCL